MRRLIFLVLFFIAFSSVAFSAASEKSIFGPVTYDVKERYGKDNAYQETFKASERLFMIKLKNGAQIPERSDFIEFKLNGETVLRDDRYDYSTLVCIAKLRKENSFELVLKDSRPSGFKRPPLPPRFVTVTVLPYSGNLPEGAYGLQTGEDLAAAAGLLRKVANPESAALAVSAINLENTVAERADAVRALADRKDASALPFLGALFKDVHVKPDIRGEAALALGILGDKRSIPALMTGVMDPDEKTRLGSTRALSFYREEDTSGLLAKMLERLDMMRRDAVIRSIIEAGWKPVGTLMKLAESEDPYVSTTAISLLGNTGDERATKLLLKLLDKPGRRDIRKIITALGQTKDARAIQPLSSMTKDPAKRAGKEAELGEALAELGDRKSADLIEAMIKKADSRQKYVRLLQAYQKLTGKEYR